MSQEKILLDKLYETFPNVNKKYILQFYLNILLVLEGARPSYSVDIIVPKPKTRHDFINVVLDIYPDTFDIFKSDSPFIFLKSNREFITSTLGIMTFKNLGIALGYCCPIRKEDANLIGIRVTVIAKHIKNKTRIYAFLIPVSMLNEIIMKSIYDKVTKYNEILNKYEYFVEFTSEVVWSLNNTKMIDGMSLNKK